MAYTAVNLTTPGAAGTRVDNTGQAGVAGGAGTGHKVRNDGSVLFYVHNTAANTPTMTFLASGTYKGEALTVANETITTVANGEYIAGPFDPEIFNDADGYIRVYYGGSNETELKFVAFKP